MVDTSPDAAKKRSEANTVKNNKHLSDLKKYFGPNGQYEIGFDQYGNYILVEYLVDKKGDRTGDTREMFFYVAPDGVGFKAYNATDIVKKIKTDYKGNYESLRKLLYDKQFISKSDFLTKNETAFNKAIVIAARNHGVEQVQKYTIDGKATFSPFGKWLTGIATLAGEGGEPTRDISLVDRDVVEGLIKDIYSKTTDMAIDDAFLKQETDRYMKQIEEGVITTQTVEGGKVVTKRTKGFSQSQVEAELPERIKKEQPNAMLPKQSFDFLAFLDGMGARLPI